LKLSIRNLKIVWKEKKLREKKVAEYHENRIKNLRLTGEGEQKIDAHHHPLFYS
jgi:hypothetical protein